MTVHADLPLTSSPWGTYVAVPPMAAFRNCRCSNRTPARPRQARVSSPVEIKRLDTDPPPVTTHESPVTLSPVNPGDKAPVEKF